VDWSIRSEVLLEILLSTAGCSGESMLSRGIINYTTSTLNYAQSNMLAEWFTARAR
jgi:hypothetical protein